MDEIDGIQVGLTIRNKLGDEHTKLIYISTSKDFVMDLFKVRVTQFIVKPLLLEQIKPILMDSIKLIEKESAQFAYKKSNTTHVIPFSNIMYFESIGKKIMIVMPNSEEVFYGSLSCLVEKKFASFIQVHRSYYVNYQYISSFNAKCLTMHNGIEINISAERKDAIISKLKNQVNLYLRGK